MTSTPTLWLRRISRSRSEPRHSRRGALDMVIEDTGLEDFLLGTGALTRSALLEARGRAGAVPLAQALTSYGYVTEDDIRRALAHTAGLPFVLLGRDDIEPEALLLVPEPLARTHNIIGFRVADGALHVALLDPLALRALEPLNLPYRVRPHITTAPGIKQGLLYYQKILKEKFTKLLEGGAHTVEAFLTHALLSRAHGVHIDLSTTATLVRYRVGHALHEAMHLPEEAGRALAARFKELAGLVASAAVPQEGRFKFEHEGGERYALHVHTHPTAQGEKLSLGIRRESAGQNGFSLRSLGLHGEALEEVHKLLHTRSGLVLVAAPRGGGKTTTLYTLLDQLSPHELAITTVEETITEHLPYVAQTYINPALGIGFAAALRGVLKTHPDVVMVERIAEKQVAALAAEAASLGTLVLAGIEANSTTEVIEKLRAFGVSPLLLASTLRGVIAAQVVGKLCPRDMQEYRLSRAEGAPFEPRANFGRVLAALKEEDIVGQNTQWKELLFARANPCRQCQGGYIGLTGLQEVLPVTATIKELLLGNASAEELETQAREEGMLTLVEDGLFKVVQGVTSLEEVAEIASV